MTNQLKSARTIALKATVVALPAVLLAACTGTSVVTGSSSGSDRLIWQNQAIQLDTSNAPTITTSSTSGSVSAMSLPSLIPTLSLTASLASPSSAGVQLQADDITLSGSKVYLAYNVAGNTQAGGVDVIDVTLPITPTLTSEQIYPTTDIHKVYVSGGYLYTAGATSAGLTPGAVITKTLLSSGNLTSTQTSVPLMATDASGNAAYAAVSVTSNGAYIYAVAGTNGGIYKLNTADLSLVSATTLADARDLNYAGSSLYVLSGQFNGTPATIQQYTPATMAATGTTVAFPTATVAESKSTMVAGTNMNVATASSGGVRLYCRATGTTIANIPAPTVSGLTAAQETSNAASFGNGLLFVANGEAGVYVYTVEQPLGSTGCTNVTVNYRGNFTLGAGISSNNVYFSAGELYVATGLGGFKVITVVQTLLTGLVTAL